MAGEGQKGKSISDVLTTPLHKVAMPAQTVY